MSFLSELKRRNVLRVGTAYLVSSWLLIQIAETIFPLFGFGDTPARLVVIILAIGFIPSLIFSWVFEITPEGLKKDADVVREHSITQETGKKLDRIILVVLTLALAYFAFDRFILVPARVAEIVKETAQQARSDVLVESYGDKSIVVLPFVNMSDDASNEYFSDGISEELLNLLAQIPELRVISHSSAFSFKGKDIEIPEIARRLNVAHVLEGSVRKSGNTVRITAQLIEAQSDTHLWSETYDRELVDIFTIQDEIAEAVVGQLKIKLLGAAPKATKVNPQAYALFLQARQLRHQNNPESCEQAIVLLQQALSIDPAYAGAWVELSVCYFFQAFKQLRPYDEGYGLAREAVNKALASDPDYALAHAMLGWIASDQGDLAAAARHYEHALSRDPGNLDIIEGVAYLEVALGHNDISRALLDYLVTHDPLHPTVHQDRGLAYMVAGRHDEAVAGIRTALSLAPDSLSAQVAIGIALLLKGDKEAALAEMLKVKPENWRLFCLVAAYHDLGRKAESDAALAELIQKYGGDWAYSIADVLAYRGEADRAFEWLYKEVANRDLTFMEINFDPLFANIRNDPRWLPFLESIGRSPAQLDAIQFKVSLPE